MPDRPKTLCAVTGSNGYVGSCVKAYFAACGWNLLELTRRPQPGACAVAFQLGADVPPSTLAGVDALVHCAYDFKPLHWSEIRAVNVEGTRKLFQAAQAAGVRKIIYISSLSAFPRCRSLYGRAKLEIEKIARDGQAEVLRPGLVFGNTPGGMFGKLVAQIRRSSVVPLVGGGTQIQYLVHQEDLCAFVEKLAMQPQPSSRLFTVAHEQPWTFKALLLDIARALHKDVKFRPLPWRVIWFALKSAEACGLKLSFRSDSLVSLMYQNPQPDFSPNAAAGLACRPFQITDLSL
jgi:nucleoside-diphosphate-sugar epimerase